MNIIYFAWSVNALPGIVKLEMYFGLAFHVVNMHPESSPCLHWILHFWVESSVPAPALQLHSCTSCARVFPCKEAMKCLWCTTLVTFCLRDNVPWRGTSEIKGLCQVQNGVRPLSLMLAIQSCCRFGSKKVSACLTIKACIDPLARS